MSKATLINDSAFSWFVQDSDIWYPAVVEESLKAGAAVLAAEMKENLRGVIADRQAKALLQSFGITPVGQDRQRNWNVHLGFDGYQQPGTGSWRTTGIPFQMIARVFESGSVKNGYQWRRPTHFARRAVQSKRDAAQTAMKNAAETAMEKIKQQKGV